VSREKKDVAEVVVEKEKELTAEGRVVVAELV
jgi:hypothetical protein